MQQNKSINLLLVVISIALALSTMYFKLESKKDQKEYVKTAEKLEKTKDNYKNLSGKYQELKRINGLNSNEIVAKGIITKSFNTLFNYDNENFLSRYDQAERYMTKGVIDKQKGSGGTLHAPKIKVRKRVNDLKIYRQIKKDKNIIALVQMESTYTVDGKDNPSVIELYRVRVNLKTKKIDSFQLLTTLDEFSNA